MDLRICYRNITEREIKARPKIVSVFNVEILVCVFWVRGDREGAGIPGEYTAGAGAAPA